MYMYMQLEIYMQDLKLSIVDKHCFFAKHAL
jgi:hypothetical protein